MIYTYTNHNLISLMQDIGYADREQLVDFFSDTMPANRVGALIDRYVEDKFFDYEESKKRVKYSAAPEMEEEIIRRRIKAFRVLSNWGSTQIQQIYVLRYPMQYMIITPDNIVFDVTVCDSLNEAHVAAKLWNVSAVKNVPDDVNHIGIVPDHETGKKLGEYGFDSYGILDAFGRGINYYPLSS